MIKLNQTKLQGEDAAGARSSVAVSGCPGDELTGEKGTQITLVSERHSGQYLWRKGQVGYWNSLFWCTHKTNYGRFRIKIVLTGHRDSLSILIRRQHAGRADSQWRRWRPEKLRWKPEAERPRRLHVHRGGRDGQPQQGGRARGHGAVLVRTV